MADPRIKLTPKRHATIVEAISKGHYLITAAKLAGVGKSTISHWIKRGKDEDAGIYHEFALEVEIAHQKGESFLVSTVVDAVESGEWRAAAWMLERKYFKRWAKQSRVEVSGAEGAPIKIEPVSEERVMLAVQQRLESAKVESDDMFN